MSVAREHERIRVADKVPAWAPGRAPGTGNRTGTELIAQPDPRYNMRVLLNGTPFYFRSDAARDDFAATFRGKEGVSVVVVE